MRTHAWVLISLLVVLPVAGGSGGSIASAAGPRVPRAVHAPSHTPAASPQAALARIQRQLAVRRRLLVQAQQQERRALGQLSWAQERLQRAEVRLHQTTAALDGTRRGVARATKALAVVSQRLSGHEAVMGARLRVFYEQGPLGYLDVLLGAADFRDFATRSYLIGLIIDRDLRLYRQVVHEREQRDAVRATLVDREQALAEQQQRWVASRQETARLTAERRRLWEHVRSQRQSQEEAIRELETESVRITEIIRHASGGGRGGVVQTLRAGALLWPVPGPITSGYGWRIHPIFHTREFHTGIDIGAPWGTPIRAPASGTVIYTGWMRGYGMLVIVDHGNGLSTTYSHLSSYTVHVGEHIQRGQVIARIGSTGWSTGPHLFFEIRDNGQPVNPLGPP